MLVSPPTGRAEIFGERPGDEYHADDRNEVFGNFDPEVAIDDGVIHGNVQMTDYVISIVRRTPGR